MRWSRVDLPVPLAPRMATRESMLVEGRMRDGIRMVDEGKRTYSIPKERLS